MARLHIPVFQLVILLTSLLLVTSALANREIFPNTIESLHARYIDEVIAHQKYGVYAEHALQENYPAIAHLFRALAAAEAIHARNFASLLGYLGETPQMPSVKIKVLTTRKHLQQAAEVEAQEIDTEYPKILKNIKTENHSEAIRLITYAWQSEQQHRDLILQIKKAASWFFGMLVSRIEGEPTRYYVCQICGSTVTELPAGQCPVCSHPPADYREVPGFDPTKVRSIEEQTNLLD